MCIVNVERLVGGGLSCLSFLSTNCPVLALCETIAKLSRAQNRIDHKASPHVEGSIDMRRLHRWTRGYVLIYI